MANLTSLDLSCNLLQAVPDFVPKLDKLQVLNLKSNRIHYLSWKIFNIPTLDVVTIDDNPLEQLPQEILSLVRARHTMPLRMTASGPQRSGGPPQGRAEELNNADAQPAELRPHLHSVVRGPTPAAPPSPSASYLAEIPVLVELDLTGCNFTLFPTLIVSFALLQRLIMQHCQLRGIDPCIGEMLTLREWAPLLTAVSRQQNRLCKQ